MVFAAANTQTFIGSSCRARQVDGVCVVGGLIVGSAKWIMKHHGVGIFEEGKALKWLRNYIEDKIPKLKEAEARRIKKMLKGA